MLVADTVRSSHGMRAWARPVSVTWATLPDIVLVATCGFVNVPGPVVAMKLWAAWVPAARVEP